MRGSRRSAPVTTTAPTAGTAADRRGSTVYDEPASARVAYFHAEGLTEMTSPAVAAEIAAACRVNAAGLCARPPSSDDPAGERTSLRSSTSTWQRTARRNERANLFRWSSGMTYSWGAWHVGAKGRNRVL